MNKPNEGLLVKQQEETPSFVLEGIIVLNANKLKKKISKDFSASLLFVF